MGNLKIMKYFSEVSFFGMDDYVLCIYISCIAHPICVCVAMME